MRKAGNLFGMTLKSQSGLFGDELPGRTAYTSAGVICSLPGHSGHIAAFGGGGSSIKKTGRLPRSVDIITHLSIIGSFLNSGIHHSRWLFFDMAFFA